MGKPRYMESNRSRVFAADHTKGRWISGSATRPRLIDEGSPDSDTSTESRASLLGQPGLNSVVLQRELRVVV